MNTTRRQQATTLPITNHNIGTKTDEIDLALAFNEKTRTYHRIKDGK